MRKPPQLLLWFIFAIGLTAAGARMISVDEILQTEQYMLVGRQGSELFIENSNIPAGNCPRFMTDALSESDETQHYRGMHLFRDSGHAFSTQLMTVEKKNYYYDVYFYEINATKVLNNRYRNTIRISDSNMGTYHRQIFSEGRVLNNTLYDYTRQMLYLDFSTPRNVDIEQYVIYGTMGNFQTKLIETVRQRMNNTRSNLIEDPYSDAFFYTENLSDGSYLFKAPLGLLTRIVLGKENGTLVMKLSENQRLVGVSSNVVFLSDKTELNKKWKIHSSLTSTNSDSKIVCQMNSPRELLHKVVVIRNEDYCMMRDRLDYDEARCSAEQKEYMEGLISRNGDGDGEEPVNVIKWLIIACLIMFSLIVLLCVYVFWLRSSFVADDDGSGDHEKFQQDTEASLFVSKQRSFPTTYHDPGLLDVSVDKWN